jgi:hypothetical protein
MLLHRWIQNWQEHAGEIYGAERGGSIPMEERILRRLPIDLRDLTGLDEVK